ncbi:MAG: hypothetical protein IK016_09065 [Lachnospiraceae bacterium]|nr:hypothetical protein [Lachnospiraceae bacterium]
MEEENRGQDGQKNSVNPELLYVRGFHFLTKADAEKAVVDAGKIEYLESHVGYATSSALLAVYEKSIQNRIFGTPVGWSYLMDLRRRLEKMGVDPSELTPIPMTTSFTHTPGAQESVPVKEKKRKREEGEPKPPLLIVSAVLNLVLIIIVIIMFVIVAYGDTDNMVNYKRNITNRYAEWEEQLKERESIIREKERELKIDNTMYQNPGETGNN